MIGGKPAPPGIFPFMAALTWSAGGLQSECSGFIVSPTAIMAAAHCLHVSNDDTLLAANYSARLGNLDRMKGEYVVLEAFVHPRYDEKSHSNDISILKPIHGGMLPLTEYVKPIAVEGHFIKPERAIAMGWGKTTFETCVGEGGEPSRKLLYHSQQIKRLGKKKIHVKGTKSKTCMGDSGSPLVEKRDGEYVAIAILSAGDKFGHEYYTRILPQKKFIKSVVDDINFV